MLLGMQMLVAAWDAVTTKTLVNCFRKSKISSKSQKTVITEDDNLFKELEEETEFLHSVQPDLVSKNMDEASFIDFDAEFLAILFSPSDTKIIAQLLETEDVSNDNDDAIKTEDEPVYCPDRKELL